MDAVSEQFAISYSSQQRVHLDEVDEELLEVEEIRKGLDELKVGSQTCNPFAVVG